jgi:hypothetical protein
MYLKSCNIHFMDKNKYAILKTLFIIEKYKVKQSIIQCGDYRLLGCDAVYSGRKIPVFQRNLLPPLACRTLRRHSYTHHMIMALSDVTFLGFAQAHLSYVGSPKVYIYHHSTNLMHLYHVLVNKRPTYCASWESRGDSFFRE